MCESAEESYVSNVEIPPTVSRYRLSLIREADVPYEGTPVSCRHQGAAARFLADLLAGFAQEVMGALYLDGRNRAIGHTFSFLGTLTRASVEPRQLLAAGLLINAAGMIVFHLHPSGDPTPSAEDLAFTRRLDEAGRVVGVQLVDHLIIGDERHVSLRQRGGW